VSEQFIPTRFLSGVLPAALLESHRFWQDQDDNLRGYPRSETDRDQSIITVKLSTMGRIDGLNSQGAYASVSRTVGGEEQVLGNLLFAAPHSVLGNIAKVFAHVECLSHVLVWFSGSSIPGAEPSIVSLELPRLKLTFKERILDGRRVLFSIDHASLFLPDYTIGNSAQVCYASKPPHPPPPPPPPSFN
jgi:hypothetical protein